MRLAATAISSALLLLAVAAQAEPVRRGVQVQGSLGLSDCTGGACSNGDELRFYNTRIALGLEASGWYRPVPLFSVGGGLHYNILGLRDRDRVTSDGDYWSFEIGGRVHPLQHGPLDAWGGLGVGYMAYSISSDFTDMNIQEDESTNAVFFAVSVGAEWYLAPRMSVGGLFQIAFPSWMTQCLDTELGHDCDDVSDQPDSVQRDYPTTVWFMGGTFSYHLGG